MNDSIPERPTKPLFALMSPLLALSLAATAWGQAGDRKDKEGDVQAEIWKQVDVPPAPILSPQESLESIQLAPGFRLELVASEPLVNDPVTIAWDEDGRLYAVEMRAYMPDVDGNGEEEPIGRIVVLEDTDDDGVMDKSTVVLDGLVLPRAISVVKGGLLVAEPPTLWFCEDLDGDLKVDRKTEVAEYAKTGSVEHRENALMRGLDNWLYNAKSDRRFKWDGKKLKIEETAERGQWGMTKDDFGRLFYNTNSNPVLADYQPYEYTNRNPGYPSKAGLKVDAASTREVFSNRVNLGVNRGYRGPTLREDYRLNTATAASGIAIYRGNQYPNSFYGNLFVPEPSGNVVMRYEIQEGEFELVANKRVEDDPVWEKVDFLASTDERFRPVDIPTGPDGFLYIVDLYRGILQHKMFVTTFLRKQIIERELDKPTGLGRIYRIVHDSSVRESLPKLSVKSNTELIDLLGSNNGWIRDTAQRLLVETDSIQPGELSHLKHTAVSGNERAAIHALWTLEGRGEIDERTVVQSLRRPEPWVKVHTIRASEGLISKSNAHSSLRQAFEKTLTDSSFRVRLQAVQSLSVIRDDALVINHINRIFHPDLPNEYMEDAIVSSLSGRELEFLTQASRNDIWLENAGRSAVLGKLVIALFSKRDADSLLTLAPLLASGVPENWRAYAIITGLAHYAGRPESRPIKLDAKPEVFYSLIETLSESSDDVKEGLDMTFTWPGRASNNPLDGLNKKQLLAISEGEAIYAATCVACHQKDGNGLPGLAPPLNGSDWVNGSAERLALMVYHGISGPIEVKGETWNSVMPGHGVMPQFQGKGLQQVLSYIRTAWGNKSGTVHPDEIQAVIDANQDRVMPWTVEELKKKGY